MTWRSLLKALVPFLVVGLSGEVATSYSPESSSPDSLRVLYTANEGVLVEYGRTRVLIDGLHRPYQPMYASLPAPIAARLELAESPFNDIDLILVSHRHRDHFHPEAVAKYLHSSTRTMLVSSPQVVQEVLQEADQLRDQVAVIFAEPGNSVDYKTDDVSIAFLGLPHGGERHKAVQNLGHVLHLAGRRVLHLGDAAIDPSVFENLNLSSQGIDVGLIPYWYLLDDAGRMLVNEQVSPGLVVAIHVPPDEREDVRRRIARYYPSAIVFDEPLESRVSLASATMN